MVALTIGMATYKDFDGVYFTIQALRLYQDLTDTELVVVDNFGDDHTRDFVEGWAKGRYILAKDAVGTAAPRRTWSSRRRRGDAVLCCDSHVLFVPGAIARLQGLLPGPSRTSIDLLQGPLVYDDLTSISTHFAPEWRGQMWGTWATDPRGQDPEGEPFDIPMQGMGRFLPADAWPGFNPAVSRLRRGRGVYPREGAAARRADAVPALAALGPPLRPAGGGAVPALHRGQAAQLRHRVHRAGAGSGAGDAATSRSRCRRRRSSGSWRRCVLPGRR